MSGTVNIDGTDKALCGGYVNIGGTWKKIFENVDTTISSNAATASKIVSPYKAWVNGELVIGNIPSQASKTITPSKSEQTAVSSGVYTTGAIKVAAIPSEYVVPNGTRYVTENGTYDVKSFESVNVNVEANGGNSIYARVDKTLADTYNYGATVLPIDAIATNDVSTLPVAKAISVVKTTELQETISAFYIYEYGIWGGAILHYNRNNGVQVTQVEDCVYFMRNPDTGKYILCVDSGSNIAYDSGTYHVIVHYD